MITPITVRFPKNMIDCVPPDAMKAAGIACAVAAVVRYPFACLYLLPLYCFVKGVSYIVYSLTGGKGIAFIRPSLPYSSGLTLKKQIDELRKSGDSNWRDQAIVLIRQSRLSSSTDELQRLRGASILDKKTEASLNAAINKVLGSDAGYLYLNKYNRIKMVYAQAIEIKKIYSDEYDVFIHAQASPWFVISSLVKELWRLNNPDVDLHHFKSLRAPCSTAEAGLLEKAYQTLSSEGIEKYRDRWLQLLTLSDSDPKVREELLSCDAYFFNPSAYESALFFLSHNSNIIDSKELIYNIAKKTIGHFYPNSTPKQTAIFAKKIVRTMESDALCGNLFVICVPKNKSNSIQYRAHPFGLTCQCHPQKRARDILDKLEKGILDDSTKCTTILSKTSVPQFRLYLPAIKPENDNHIFLLSSLPKEKKHHMKSALKEIVAEQHKTLLAANKSTVVNG